MRKVLKLARREYIATVKTKGFIIGLVLAPILMSGGIIAMAIAERHTDTDDKTIAVIDRSAVMAEALSSAAAHRNENEIYDKKKDKKVKPAYQIEIAEPEEEDLRAQRLALSDRVRDGSLHGFVEIGPEVVHPGENGDASRVKYYAKNAALDDLRQWIGRQLDGELRRLRLRDAGINESQVKDLFKRQGVEGLGLVTMDETGKIKDAKRSNEAVVIMVPMFMMMMMFMMIMMGAAPLLQSVMEEKNQRISEVLLGSVRPFEFMMAKVVGGVCVALTASTVYIVGGIVSVTHMGFSEFIPYAILPWFFVYMIMAIVMVGAMFAAIGSACNDAKEAQSLTLPVMLPIMIPLFILGPILKAPLGTFATTMSLIPPFTPMLMLLRQSVPSGVPAWQPWVGLFGVLCCTVLAVWIGGRIFRVAIIMQGSPAKFSNLIRWTIRG